VTKSIESDARPSEFSDRDASDVSAASNRGAWLFSKSIDIAVFGGSAGLAGLLLILGWSVGSLDRETPDWTWIPAVLLVDVAHVYSTELRIYLDGAELRRRPFLYTVVPVGGFLVSLALLTFGETVFWRVLAYVAVFHFVRQQYGWVALYRRRAGETDRLGHWIDTTAIYSATLFPLIYWHCNLPRNFWWFLEGDFAAGAPADVARWLEPVYWTIMGTYVARSLWLRVFRSQSNPGKDLVVTTTAACWYLGIVAFDSDYAFTVTNVLIHGVPYLALIYFSGIKAVRRTPDSAIARFFRLGVVPFLLSLWVLAYVEELLWHRFVWWDREWLFGDALDAGPFRFLAVALLALPQIVHYALDGFIWKRDQARYL